MDMKDDADGMVQLSVAAGPSKDVRNKKPAPRLFHCYECFAAAAPGAMKQRRLSDLETHIAWRHARYARYQCQLPHCRQTEWTLPKMLAHARRHNHKSGSTVTRLALPELERLHDRILLASLALSLGKSARLSFKPMQELSLLAEAQPADRNARLVWPYPRLSRVNVRKGYTYDSGRCSKAAPVKQLAELQAARPLEEMLSDSALDLELEECDAVDETIALSEADVASPLAPSAADEARRCRLCRTQLVVPDYLDRHIYCTHIGRWPFECVFCHKSFVLGEEAQVRAHKHAKVVRNDLRQQLEVYMLRCFGLSDSSKLEETRRQQSANSADNQAGALANLSQCLLERPVACWTDAPGEPIPSNLLKNLRNFCCAICDEPERYWKNRDGHIYSTHLKSLPFSCSQCPHSAFERRVSALKHVAMHSRYATNADRRHSLVDNSEALKARLNRLRRLCFGWSPGMVEGAAD